MTKIYPDPRFGPALIQTAARTCLALQDDGDDDCGGRGGGGGVVDDDDYAAADGRATVDNLGP